jgi:ribonuclease BN (tRNA processing enzyme)
MIKIIFLGTNGWYDTQTGNTVCILIQSANYDIVLDAGNGFPKLMDYLSFNRPVYLFLSHYHLDHIIGLHTLNKFDFKEGLHIAGPDGLKNMLNTIIQKPYTFPFSKLPYPTKVYEISHLRQGFGGQDLPIPFEYATLLHPVLTYGYRFKFDNKIIVYCTDTGYCENAVKLAKDADLLITECAYKRGMKVTQWPHLNPDDAAKLAKAANARKLVLTHFDADIYPTLESRKQAERQAKETFSNIITAEDSIEITIKKTNNRI